MSEAVTKDNVRKLIVKLVMNGWTQKDEKRVSSKFIVYVKSLYPDAQVESVQQGFALRGVKGVNCSAATEAGVWAQAARALAK